MFEPQPIRIREAYQQASSFLAQKGIDSPTFEAELLMRRLLQIDRTHFFMKLDEPFPVELQSRWDEWLQRRGVGEPIQYILGDQEFFGRLFEVNPSVLIPRPETEILIETVLTTADQLWSQEPLHVVDVGTGSGAIAVTLAAERPHWKVTAIDISLSALEIAQKNATKHGVREQITWIHGEYLHPLSTNTPVDICVSNPPYIPTDVVPTLEKQVAQYEPLLALDGGVDGLEPYRVLTKQLAQWKAKKQLICFEIGSEQGQAVSSWVSQISLEMTVQVKQDLAGRDRVVVGYCNSNI
ncbi:peptide chain release factor N(5)-glutamine methyltransferase [Hazenella coriacea]|uniref:Release factor glutamine methyltransferase n=1 Tax=Hazenella coriacea TaxID=1179467 RepID=A0A4R3LB97_9BACL|nr:peptide chain release factor N(5)-glutamine methyltransferase [Hazenella coriacea]TCS95574.1 release factor glutamine methyltransferase [Hazenella coriacea]